MAIDLTKPYIVIPKLINQPTWGGSRIVELQGWRELFSNSKIRIGQSYELYGNSKLSASIFDTSSSDFRPEVGNPNDHEEHPEFKLARDSYITLPEMMAEDNEATVGPYVWQTFKKMPMLNKLNDSKGNSFQLHLRQGETHDRWIPKAESWYYLDDGVATYGLVAGCDVEKFKSVCKEIETFMKSQSAAVVAGEKTVDEARNEAKAYILERNPHQYVNIQLIKKHQMLDLSPGGIHHSWEDGSAMGVKSNFLYEVQQDVMDPVCTIRSFDQGKIKDDGTIREIHIDDYFSYIDTDPGRNDVEFALRTPNGESLLKTKNYSIDVIELASTRSEKIIDSFVHFFVRDGGVTVTTDSGEVHVTKGHSCFVPFAAGSYTLKPDVDNETCLVKTYIER